MFEDFPFCLYIVAASESKKGLVRLGEPSNYRMSQKVEKLHNFRPPGCFGLFEFGNCFYTLCIFQLTTLLLLPIMQCCCDSGLVIVLSITLALLVCVLWLLAYDFTAPCDHIGVNSTVSVCVCRRINVNVL